MGSNAKTAVFHNIKNQQDKITDEVSIAFGDTVATKTSSVACSLKLSNLNLG